jgi:hypothetical protein
MSKLKLDVAALRVESFSMTDEAAGPRGTVRAHDSAVDSEGWDTCDGSGVYTCDYGTICLPQSTMAPSCGGQFSCKCTDPQFCDG